MTLLMEYIIHISRLSRSHAVNHTRTLDPTRPITSAIAQPFADTDPSVRQLDIIGLMSEDDDDDDHNIDNIPVREAPASHHQHHSSSSSGSRPLLLTLEYDGAETSSGGRHNNRFPSSVWSVGQQRELLTRHFRAFDRLRQLGGGPLLVGEFVNSFADYRTDRALSTATSSMMDVGMERGIFTRQRHPKAAAWLLRQRYRLLAEEAGLAGMAGKMGALCELPADLFPYAIARLSSLAMDASAHTFGFVPCDADYS